MAAICLGLNVLISLLLQGINNQVIGAIFPEEMIMTMTEQSIIQRYTSEQNTLVCLLLIEWSTWYRSLIIEWGDVKVTFLKEW